MAGSPHKFTLEDLLKSAEPKMKQFKLCENIINQRETLFLNKKLMDLDEYGEKNTSFEEMLDSFGIKLGDKNERNN